MSIAERIRSFLEEHDIQYDHHRHDPVYTAQEVAAADHVPGREMAKTVVMTNGERFVMAVLPATRRVDVDRFREAVGDEGFRLAEEDEFEDLFPGCETGAMPPFGSLYDVPVLVDQTLRQDETITFNAGTHADTITVAYSEFEDVEEPGVADFSKPLEGA